jgi:hypothetical protein
VFHLDTAYSLCRGALVQRFIELRTAFVRTYPTSYELPDILDIIREDIRLSNNDDDHIIKKFSEWCAILDYFEIQLEVARTMSNFGCPHWLVWTGELEIPYGVIRVYLTTHDWSICALHYWRNQELSQFTLTHPRHSDYEFVAEDRIPYGTLFGTRTIDRLRMERQCSDLEVHVLRDTNSTQRFSLVPLTESYDECPSIVFVDHSFISRTHSSSDILVGPLLIDPDGQSLCCCWDKELAEDLWEDAVANFGRNAIRIMTSFGNNFTADALIEEYRNRREFSNR